MNVLDENVPKSQRLLLWDWHVAVRQIGVDVTRKGLQDDENVPFLLRMRRRTFIKRDSDFYKRGFRHARYYLVFVDAGQYEMAIVVRRFLHQPESVT